MQLPENVVSQLIPEGLPDGDLYPPEKFDNFPGEYPDEEIPSARQPSDNYRSYRWAQAILKEVLSQRESISGSHLGWSDVSAGFIYEGSSDYPSRYKIQDGWTFGACILIKDHVIGDWLTINHINVSGKTFPVIFKFGQISLHSIPPNPGSGSSACWVKNASPHTNKKWGYGILTCRHVVNGIQLAQVVTLTPSKVYARPQSGTLADQDPLCIDAAIIEFPKNDWPAGLVQMNIPNPAGRHPIAPGMPISCYFKNGTSNGSILRIFQNQPYFGNLIANRVIIDVYGAPGDSGSLVSHNKHNKVDGVGVYMGKIPDGRGGWEGICQDMWQVMKYFDISFHI
ncbi:hypothetical protein [Chitinophaga sp. HK235]|uniref:hypothetical protein n=1 Tax=Chitinophaga sp. HK235 TaxID=2952571 RepID=UPI001BA81EE4|nr:hypothetical protein [Chitinophaga sp. HK235]